MPLVQPATQWDAGEVLGIFPDRALFCCSATTQRGTQCKNSCEYGRIEARNILRHLSQMGPTSPRLQRHLEMLAGCCLCNRWHRDKPMQSQRVQVVQKWLRMAAAYNTAMERQLRNHQEQVRPASEAYTSTGSSRTLSSRTIQTLSSTQASSSTASSESSRTVNESDSDSSGPSTPPGSPRPTPTIRTDSSHTLSHETVRGSSDDSATLASNSAASSHTIARADQSARNQHQAAVPRAPLITPPITPRRSRSPTPAETHSERAQFIDHFLTWLETRYILTPRPSPSREATPTLVPEISRRSHTSTENRVRRKTIVEDCPVCKLEIEHPDDAVWCRAKCGNNLHRSCFRQWRESCLSTPRRCVTCVWCREPWLNEYEA